MTGANGTTGGGAGDPEIIDVRRGMFGANGSGDTSGYGRLIRSVALYFSLRKLLSIKLS